MSPIPRRRLVAWMLTLGGVAAVASVAARAQVVEIAGTPRGSQAPGQTVGPTVGTAMVLGQVIDASGAPISRALVNLGPNRIFTNAEGRFVFTDLPKGSYVIGATKPGYLAGSFGQRRPDGPPQRLELSDGEANGVAKITLWRTSSISGTLYDDAGEPLVGVPIWSLIRSYAKGRAYWEDGPSATTDDRGVYRLGSLSPGDYALCVVNAQSTMPAALLDAYAAARVGGTAAEFQRQYDVDAIGFSARIPTAGIRVGDAVLHTVGPFSGGMIPPTPGESGVIYSFQSTCAPDSIGLSRAQIVTLTAGEERTGADIRLALVPGTLIEGTVVGPDGPLANVGVRLAPDFGPDLNFELTWESALTISDARGRFTFIGVPPGEYILRALKAPPAPRPIPPGIVTVGGVAVAVASGPVASPLPPGTVPSPPPLPTEPTLWANTPLAVGPSGLSNVTVRLAAGFRISGRVQFEGAAARPAPNVVQNIRVTLEPADGHQLGYPLFARTDPDGTFSTYQVPPGKYVLRVTRPGGAAPWVYRTATANGRDVGVRALDLQGDVSNVIVVMTDAPSEIAGVVRDDTGRIDPTAGVVVFPAEPAEWSNFGETSRRMSYVRPSQSGSWRVVALPAGQYYVAAIDDAQGTNWQNPRMLESISRVAERVTLGDGERKTLDLQTRATR